MGRGNRKEVRLVLKLLRKRNCRVGICSMYSVRDVSFMRRGGEVGGGNGVPSF